MQAARAPLPGALALLGMALTPACTKAVASTDPVGNTTVQVATVPASLPPPVEKKKVDPDANACPAGMVLVDGEYCPEVEQKCLEWMDPPSTSTMPKVHRRYCIDATERTETDGSNLPRHFMSWTSSKNLCEADGARLCLESEWIFACEGEEMRPYPYGWERDSEACNVDRSENIGRPGRLVDHRDVAGSHAKCASPFGVQDLAGNVEEWVQADKGKKMGWKEVLKGSWWIPSRHACRQFQVGHNDVYNGAETGTRCCKDAPPREVASN
jgi:formylglycine-generating enzyme